MVNFCFREIASETYVGKIVVDSHDFGSIECPWSHEVNLIKPAVIGGVRLNSTNVHVSI